MNTVASPLTARDRGTVALELPLAVGLLLLPVAVIVMTIPQWPEAKTVAHSAANEAAALYATAPSAESGIESATASVTAAEQNYGRPMSATFDGEWCRGCTVTVTITIDIPAIDVPFIGSTGTFSYTATSTARVEDYRSL